MGLELPSIGLNLTLGAKMSPTRFVAIKRQSHFRMSAVIATKS